MTSLITTDLVRLGADWGSDKHDVIRALAAVVDDAGRATSKEQLVEDAFARESTSATGLPSCVRDSSSARTTPPTVSATGWRASPSPATGRSSRRRSMTG